ncbi:MAG: hypothetical protein AB1349_12345 [Elusimicrobiota bacterium]
MTLKDVLLQVVKIAKEIQSETGFMFSSEAVVSLAQTVYNNALKDIRVELMNGNGKLQAVGKNPSGVKLATEKQIALLQKIDKEQGGAVMNDLLSRGIRTTAGLTMTIASELITNFGKTPTATPPPKPTPTKEVPQKTETPTESITEKQIKYLYVLASKLGHGNGQAKDWLKNYFKVASLNALTKAQAKSGIDALQRQVN